MKEEITDEILNYTCLADEATEELENSPSRLPTGLQCRPQPSLDEEHSEFQRIVGGIPGELPLSPKVLSTLSFL